MSLRFPSTYNSPALVSAAGVAIVLGIPTLELTTASLAALKGANVLAFLTNVGAVSVPGRLDGQEQQQAMKNGNFSNIDETSGSDAEKTQQRQHDKNPYFSRRTRTLVNPSGYAFSIWGPIYLGEAAFVATQLVASPESTLAFTILPQLTAPFVAANLTQSLWCAAFRPSYNDGWSKYVSAGLLCATAYSLDKVHIITCAAPTPAWYFIPLTMHYGWMTAATLVNLNGSMAMQESISDSTLCKVGHVSILAATVLGVYITTIRTSPTYGLTIAWALLACAKGMTQRLENKESLHNKSVELQQGAKVQRVLCWIGTAASVGAAAFVSIV